MDADTIGRVLLMKNHWDLIDHHKGPFGQRCPSRAIINCPSIAPTKKWDPLTPEVPSME
jgi:hypothetical protein